MGLNGNGNRRISRRAFLGMGAALAIGARGASAAEAGYGRLYPDPGGVVELPKGFQYRIISPEGTKLSNGAPVPSDFDGMAAFRGPKRGTTLLVRNHELSVSDGTSGDNEPVEGTNPYDETQPGGTTGILVDNQSRRAMKDFVTSSVQSTNCAGGATTPGTQPNPLLDNYEGLTLGPRLPGGRRTLLLQSDDNFSAGQVTRVVALGVENGQLR